MTNLIHKKKFFTNLTGIYADSRDGGLARFTATTVKTMGALAIIRQYIDSTPGVNTHKYIIQSGRAYRSPGSPQNHPAGIAMDFEFEVNGQKLPRLVLYGIISRLIKDKKLPPGGLGIYAGVDRKEGDPVVQGANVYRVNFNKNDSVHYDHRGKSIGKTWAPRTKNSGGSRWMYICFDISHPACDDGEHSFKFGSLQKLKKWEQHDSGHYYCPDGGNKRGKDPNTEGVEKFALLHKDDYENIIKPFSPSRAINVAANYTIPGASSGFNMDTANIMSLSEYEKRVWSNDECCTLA